MDIWNEGGAPVRVLIDPRAIAVEVAEEGLMAMMCEGIEDLEEAGVHFHAHASVIATPQVGPGVRVTLNANGAWQGNLPAQAQRVDLRVEAGIWLPDGTQVLNVVVVARWDESDGAGAHGLGWPFVSLRCSAMPSESWGREFERVWESGELNPVEIATGTEQMIDEAVRVLECQDGEGLWKDERAALPTNQ